jgi:hypothetical protein
MTVESELRLSLLGRSGKTLEAYLRGPLNGHFLSKEYIYGVAERRNELHSRLGKASAQLFVLTTALAFFDSLAGTEVSFLGFKMVIKPAMAVAICFVTSSAFMAAVLAFLDNLLIDNYLATIGRSVGMYSFGLFVLPKSSVNLWAEALTPKFFGPISAGGHKLAMGLIALFYTVLTLSLALYPTIVCGSFIWQTLLKPEKTIPEAALASLSLLIVCAAWLLGIGFSIRFKFKAADFDEADGSPTDDFSARMKSEAEAGKTPE